MCGRYALRARPEELRDLFGPLDQPDMPPRYNIAPTQPIAIVVSEGGRRRLKPVRWGFIPSWVGDPDRFSLIINARSETAHEKPTFRAALKRRRCLVPASGFYEWAGDGKTGKTPYWIAPRAGGVIAFAGLWETWSGADGCEVDTAAIMTTSANEALAPLHHRMPVVIDPKAFDFWLDAEGPADALAPLFEPVADDFFATHPVSRRVNQVRNDDADLIAPAEPDDPPADRGDDAGQLSLF